MVESVLVHRSVATGEIAFGRSDIDLLMIVRQPRGECADSPELARLLGWLRMARISNPALGHIEVHDPAGIARWVRLDSYRGSQDRRSAILLAGKPVELARMPVRREDAVRRFGVWAEGFFSTAVRQRNRRNLRKTTLEMWCAWAAAMGVIEEPCLTRPEMAALWAASADGALLGVIDHSPISAPAVVFGLAKRLHERLLPPLRALPQPLVMRMLMPPRYRQRTLVVIPRADSPLPPEAFQPGSFLCTPEVFDLCLHFLNPFLTWVCPPELTALGIEPPAFETFARAGRFFGHNHTLRNPGFIHKDTWTAPAFVELMRHALPYLESGRIPPPLDDGTIARLAADQPTCAEYYRRVFPSVYHESEAQWERLERLP